MKLPAIYVKTKGMCHQHTVYISYITIKNGDMTWKERLTFRLRVCYLTMKALGKVKRQNQSQILQNGQCLKTIRRINLNPNRLPEYGDLPTKLIGRLHYLKGREVMHYV